MLMPACQSALTADGHTEHRIQDTGLRKLLVASCGLPETSSRYALREDIFVTINILLCARRFVECWPNVCATAHQTRITTSPCAIFINTSAQKSIQV